MFKCPFSEVQARVCALSQVLFYSAGVLHIKGEEHFNLIAN